MQLTENFTLEEMYESSSAKKYNINNTPTDVYKQNIINLVTNVLQPIRTAWGAPIMINSGFRCAALNKKIGGATNSDHMFGAAADIRTVSNTLADNKKLWDLIIKLKNEGKIKCRQIIFEYGKKSVGPKWVHVSINNQFNSHKDNQIVYVGV